VHAIILAGGKGERLRPLTDDRPKGMVQISGRPILAYQLAWLKRYGVQDVTISCGYLANVIQDYFGDGDRFGVRISYAVEAEPLGRGGGFRFAMSGFSTDEPIVGTNGDIITNLNLTRALEEHRRSGAMATDVLAPLQSPYGIVDIDDQHYITAFREKPELPYWLNAGIYIFDPAIRDLLPERGDHEDTTFPELVAQGRLLGYPTRSYWRPADTIKDVNELQRDLTGRELDEFLASGP
jgi:NDP-sugar pyrophosphorylase family protein